MGAGEEFSVFRDGFLRWTASEAASYPCPHGCGCAHEIIRHADGSVVGVCVCADLGGCPDLHLSAEHIVVWELNWSKLARGLCQAFGLESKTASFDLGHTRQVGSWSAEAVPVILTIQSQRDHFLHAVGQLAARLRQKFILLTPTHRWVDAAAKEILAQAGAEVFCLDSHLLLVGKGVLNSRTRPGDLFSAFNPQPKEALGEETARQAFALIQQLDASPAFAKPPSALTVFRLYCMEELSAERIARKLGCSKGTVINRLNLIRQKTGSDPGALRKFSPHLQSLEETLTDPRAARIRRRNLVCENEETDGF
jgi:hypothetical protein